MTTQPRRSEAPPAVTATAEPDEPLVEDDHELVEADLLVEDVSIDGMCGVYYVRPTVSAVAPGRLVEQFELGSRCSDLPDVGTDVRVQPGVRALPVEHWPPRPAGAVHRGVQEVIDELERMQVFYVNIGGGERTFRPDFWHLVEYAVATASG